MIRHIIAKLQRFRGVTRNDRLDSCRNALGVGLGLRCLGVLAKTRARDQTLMQLMTEGC